jgi:hypothetical protein
MDRRSTTSVPREAQSVEIMYALLTSAVLVVLLTLAGWGVLSLLGVDHTSTMSIARGGIPALIALAAVRVVIAIRRFDRRTAR